MNLSLLSYILLLCFCRSVHPQIGIYLLLFKSNKTKLILLTFHSPQASNVTPQTVAKCWNKIKNSLFTSRGLSAYQFWVASQSSPVNWFWDSLQNWHFRRRFFAYHLQTFCSWFGQLFVCCTKWFRNGHTVYFGHCKRFAHSIKLKLPLFLRKKGGIYSTRSVIQFSIDVWRIRFWGPIHFFLFDGFLLDVALFKTNANITNFAAFPK